MIRIATLLCLLGAGDRATAPLELRNPVQDKNFYLLSLIQRDRRLCDAMRADAVLGELAKRKRDALKAAESGTTLGKVTGLDKIKFSEDDIQQVSEFFKRKSTSCEGLASGVRSSHAYFRFEGLADSDLLARAWQDCAKGIDLSIDVYGLQTEPGHSPEINGPIYLAKNPLFGGLVKTMLGVTLEEISENPLPFEPSMRVATGLLLCQDREEAGRHEPMEKGLNAAAFQAARSVQWSKFPYSLILVPGYGPEEAAIRLSPVGKLGCLKASKDYREGKAPFILVSGGYVHPDRTKFSEAVEMRSFLVEECGIPPEAVICDPHARHTTTNIRNAVRLAARYGFPMDKPVLVATNPFQATDISGIGFERRCQAVFGYQPASVYKRLSPFEVSFMPRLDSLTIDPSDPLDP